MRALARRVQDEKRRAAQAPIGAEQVPRGDALVALHVLQRRLAWPLATTSNDSAADHLLLLHDRLRVLDKVEGWGFLRAAPGVGDVVPVGPTAAGKLYGVFGDLPPGPEAVRFETGDAETIRRQGYALNRDAWIEGLSVLGVPVWQGTGAGARDLGAVMALASSSPRFDQLGEVEVAGRLLEAADRAAERLGGRRAGGAS